MIILQRLRAHMSVQTYQMHITALISLALQMLTPSVFAVPVYVWVTVVLTNAIDLQGELFLVKTMKQTNFMQE